MTIKLLRTTYFIIDNAWNNTDNIRKFETSLHKGFHNRVGSRKELLFRRKQSLQQWLCDTVHVPVGIFGNFVWKMDCHWLIKYAVKGILIGVLG